MVGNWLDSSLVSVEPAVVGRGSFSTCHRGKYCGQDVVVIEVTKDPFGRDSVTPYGRCHEDVLAYVSTLPFYG